ncbi:MULTISPECIES: hypothetical protein [Calothrix]|uniref:Uncharacterized protein n=2 Tax=Calothrix TaxID=1186 RepID=A0ABR8A8Q5_9CYAN|nr:MULTISPECIES: hypothetical protein [Calothrix]MBD2195431.1 hypothetical protein [Calothrix parietina FACHB-288]MBD2223093.1 hypothetical protein [Calothrix anomala FACHB-343]
MEQITLTSELRLEVPPYYQCHYPLVDLHLCQKTGKSMLSIVANSEFWSVPVFSVETADLVPNPVIISREKLFKQEMDLFELTIASVSSVEEGLAQISNRIQRNEPVIISGTTYELPYSPDFHNPNYLQPRNTSALGGNFQIADHYISVIGIGGDEVLLYDPIPNKFFGTISLESLAEFWRGNIQFEVFTKARGFSMLVSYGIINVTFAANYQNEKLDRIAINILNRVNNAFLEGRTRTRPGRIYLSGVALSNYIYEAFSSYYSTTGEIPQSLGKCLFDMRWSRYCLRDLLDDMNQQFNFPLSEIVDQMLAIIDLWEEVYRIFLTLVRKKSAVKDEQIQKFINFLAGTIKREHEFHCQIQDWLSKSKVREILNARTR